MLLGGVVPNCENRFDNTEVKMFECFTRAACKLSDVDSVL